MVQKEINKALIRHGLDDKFHNTVKTVYEPLANEIAKASENAFAGETNFGKAADSWKKAAEISKLLFDLEGGNEGRLEKATYFQVQTAARLNRASYYFLLDDEEKDAQTAVESAVDYMNDNMQLKEVLENAFKENA